LLRKKDIKTAKYTTWQSEICYKEVIIIHCGKREKRWMSSAWGLQGQFHRG
jgi:hypothetical protein